jgi:calcium-dependent protein kinase
LIKVLKQRGLTLLQVFEEIDDDRNGYIEVDEFHELLEKMGFTIKLEQVIELVTTMDENFDGRISYQEMRDHLASLNFNVAELEGDPRSL